MSRARAVKVISVTCALLLVAAHLSPATAAPAAQIISCVDLASGKERISKTGTCRTTEATAKWRLTPTDSALASGGTTKSLTICSNKESSPVTYQIIRAQCARHHIRNLYSRSTALAARPVIAQADSYGYDSSQITLAQNPATNPDAPIAYYTITSSRGNTQRIYSQKDLSLVINCLQGRTTYTFTVTATTVDGTSPVSASSLPVTTPAYVPPTPAATPAPTTAPLAAPAFSLSASAETRTVNTSATGFTISSTGGAIASFAINAIPAGMSFSTSTGALTGTPNTVASSTAYTITASNATGSATRTFSLTVIAVLATPAFTLTSSAETKTVNTVATGFTISSTGGAIASFAISPATPAGMSFSTSTGAFTGTPTSVAGATTYTITASNASGSATQTFTLTVSAAIYTVGQRGPGGGIVFYVSANDFTSVGSTCDTSCRYLEVAPSTWQSGGVSVADDATYRWSTNITNQTPQDKTTSSTEGVVANNVYEKFNWKIGQGFYNTSVMKVSGATSTAQAAVLAYAGSSVAGQWFIPSMNELNELCKYARGQVTGDLKVSCTSGGTFKSTANAGNDLGGFTQTCYWSSSERDVPGAWIMCFDGGFKTTPQKQTSNSVRPIRAFGP